VEHCKGHVAYVTLFALHHFHVDAKRVRKLSRLNRVVLFKAVDKHLECRVYAAMTSPSGESFFVIIASIPIR
jgi:hypothetical protein